jgi:hypothetical protein
MMIKFAKYGVMTAVALSLTACAGGVKLAPAGAYQAGSYSVNLGSDWNAIPIKTGKRKKASLLTKDGQLLNAVYLFSDLEAGDSLLRERRRENPVPKFDTELSDLELAEFLVDSLIKGGAYAGLTTQNVRPDSFNGEDAIRFDLSGNTKAGLNVEGSALMSVIDEKLNIILFMAPSEYYAAKDRADIDGIFNSVAAGRGIG